MVCSTTVKNYILLLFFNQAYNKSKKKCLAVFKEIEHSLLYGYILLYLVHTKNHYSFY